MQTKRTYCRICEAACGLLLDTDPNGHVRLRPDPDHPASAGYACKKGVRFADLARHPSRLTRPMRRGAAGLEPARWEQALDDIAARIRGIQKRHGRDAVGVYTGNPLAFSLLGTLAAQRLGQALGTRNLFSAASQDASNKFAAGALVHGSPLLHPIPDLEHTRLAIMLGTNPAVSLSSFFHMAGGTRVLDDLVARDGEVVWVDPRRTESARRWGEHLPIRPGADVALLLALVHLLRDGARPDPRVQGLDAVLRLAARFPPERAARVTGIPAERIEALAARIAASPATTFHLSTGVNMGGFGTLAVVALQALAFVSGNLDRRGGLVFAGLGPAVARLARTLGVDRARRPSRIGGFAPVMDMLPAGILADEILTPGEGQLRALVVIAGDPLRSIPGSGRLREALASLDLLVGVDLFENETGSLAHWLLPSTSWLERWDVATTSIPLQATGFVQAAGPALAPPGDARTEAWICGGLLRALKRDRAVGALLQRPLDRWLPVFEPGLRTRNAEPGSYLGRGPLTPGHVVRLWSPELEPEAHRLEEAARALEAPGFRLIGRRLKLAHNSWIHGGVRGPSPAPVATMAPEELARLGVEPGGLVRIGTPAGEATLAAEPEDGMAPGVVCVPHSLQTFNVNALIPSGQDAVERPSGQHHMTGVRVDVSAA